MKSIAESIDQILFESKPKLMAISPELAGQKPSAQEWSKQEILGHLIDSAYNNHQWVVRTSMNRGLDFSPYHQQEWVALQDYNKRDWFTLIDLWIQVNLHLCNAMQHVSQEALEYQCNLGKEQPVLLEFIITDYPRHMLMHLEDILGE
ncbi:MAG: hypothetical protein JEZ00_06965 [Anaerolineaceae bacterium]|nr:hypothetical protein [Anaerolineaceae bacterium]